MKDFDFDEIDQAVASASGSSAPAVEPASVGDSTSVAVKTQSNPVSPSTPASRRSSGRFMDMVHSSSDMRSSSPVQPRPTEVSVPERPVEKDDTPTTDMPDPLDFHGFNMDESPAVPSEPAATEEPKPLETPFLSDAKVEKRPLGAFSSFEPTTKEESAEEETPLIEAPEQPELLESGDPEPIIESEPAPEPVAEPEKLAGTSAEPVEEPEVPVVPPITQQYKEQAPSNDQPTGAIFDTESYHQALTHPAKKKSGIFVVIWIITLLLVGGGAGAAVYFFVLPLL